MPRTTSKAAQAAADKAEQEEADRFAILSPREALALAQEELPSARRQPKPLDEGIAAILDAMDEDGGWVPIGTFNGSSAGANGKLRALKLSAEVAGYEDALFASRGNEAGTRTIWVTRDAEAAERAAASPSPRRARKARK